MDPISALPLELFLQVFSDLPLEDVCRLQAVSRSWRSLLQADEVLKWAHQRWAADSDSDSSDGGTDHEVTATAVQSRISSMAALRRGRPCTFVSWPFDPCRCEPFDYSKTLCDPFDHYRALEYADSLTLQGHRIAYFLRKDTPRVVIRDLVTGNVAILKSRFGGNVQDLTLTSELVAFRVEPNHDSHICTASASANFEDLYTWTSSHAILGLRAFRQSVLMLVKHRGQWRFRKCDHLTKRVEQWNIDSKGFKDICRLYGKNWHEEGNYTLLYDEESHLIDLFTVATCYIAESEDCNQRAVHRRYKLHGVTARLISIASIGPWFVEGPEEIQRVIPSGFKGKYLMPLISLDSIGGQAPVLLLHFDASTCHMRLLQQLDYERTSRAFWRDIEFGLSLKRRSRTRSKYFGVEFSNPSPEDLPLYTDDNLDFDQQEDSLMFSCVHNLGFPTRYPGRVVNSGSSPMVINATFLVLVIATELESKENYSPPTYKCRDDKEKELAAMEEIDSCGGDENHAAPGRVDNVCGIARTYRTPQVRAEQGAGGPRLAIFCFDPNLKLAGTPQTIHHLRRPEQLCKLVYDSDDSEAGFDPSDDESDNQY